MYKIIMNEVTKKVKSFVLKNKYLCIKNYKYYSSVVFSLLLRALNLVNNSKVLISISL